MLNISSGFISSNHRLLHVTLKTDNLKGGPEIPQPLPLYKISFSFILFDVFYKKKKIEPTDLLVTRN